jgi:hypothetical protein
MAAVGSSGEAPQTSGAEDTETLPGGGVGGINQRLFWGTTGVSLYCWAGAASK